MQTTERADAPAQAVAHADEEIHEPSAETVILARAACIDQHVTDWLTSQQEDQALKAAIKWISSQKVQDLKHLLGDDANTEEGKDILKDQRKVKLYHGALYSFHTPASKLEEVLQFMVLKAHQVGAMNRCHHDAGHQCQQHIMGLLNYQFW